MKPGLLLLSLLSLAGCGYVGETLPPALRLPQRVQNLSAVQRGPKLIVQFSLPTLTTEGQTIRGTPTTELLVGPYHAARGFQVNDWLPGTRKVLDETGKTRLELEVADLAGRDAAVAVKLLNDRGKDAGLSNIVLLPIVPPVAPPGDLRAVSDAKGARVVWSGSAPGYRVFRKGPEDKDWVLLGATDQSEYVDATAKYGVRYEYLVQGIRTTGQSVAESELPASVELTPKDTFPPAAPVGLTGLAGVQSIELSWERNTDPDLAGYRVYRAEGNSAWTLLAEVKGAPSYSDRKAEHGKSYRYAVSAVDTAGNESAHAVEVSVTLP